MPDPRDFQELIRQARSGNEAASADLVRLFEPFIQRVVRIRMGPRGDRGPIGHEFGSSDVCQSVFRSLFRGLKENRYQFDQPDDLKRLLRVMIRFNVATKARRSSVKLRELIDDFEKAGWIDSAPSTGQEVADHDLVEAILDQFSEDELEVITMHLDGATWADIARKLDCNADALRIRMGRAVARVRSKMAAEDRAGT